MSDLTRVLFFLIPSLAASIYGLAAVFPKTKGLYYRMPVFSMICIAIGELSYFVLLITGNSLDNCFNVGSLGPLGAALFLLASNIGPVAVLLDEPGLDNTENKQARISAMTAPVIAIITFVATDLTWVKEYAANDWEFWYTTTSFFIMTVITAITSYYTMKASLLKHPKKSFAWCMRPYNTVITLFLLACCVERVFRIYNPATVIETVILWGFYSAVAVIMLISIPMLERGREQFLTL